MSLRSDDMPFGQDYCSAREEQSVRSSDALVMFSSLVSSDLTMEKMKFGKMRQGEKVTRMCSDPYTRTESFQDMGWAFRRSESDQTVMNTKVKLTRTEAEWAFGRFPLYSSSRRVFQTTLERIPENSKEDDANEDLDDKEFTNRAGVTIDIKRGAAKELDEAGREIRKHNGKIIAMSMKKVGTV